MKQMGDWRLWGIGDQEITPMIEHFVGLKAGNPARFPDLTKLTRLAFDPAQPKDRVLEIVFWLELIAPERAKEVKKALHIPPATGEGHNISALTQGIGEKKYRSYAERGKTERKKKVYSIGYKPHRKIKMGAPHKTKYGTVYF